MGDEDIKKEFVLAKETRLYISNKKYRQGNLTRAEVNGVTTLYVSPNYVVEIDDTVETIQKYYAFGSMRVAMRTIAGETDTLQWLLSDHLGSTSIVANEYGSYYSELRYSAFGEIRFSYNITPTDYRYTGQLAQAEIGLYYYGARWYDPNLGRFVQADTIVPGAGNPLAWDRYAYVLNNPVRLVDPSGHVNQSLIDGIGSATWFLQTTNNEISQSTAEENGYTNNYDTDNDGFPNEPDPFAPPLELHTHWDPLCTGGNDLTECLYRRGIMPSGTYDVTWDQVNQLMLAIFYDVSHRTHTFSQNSPQSWWDRGSYDTPFYDGSGQTQVNICLDNDCYQGYEVNYIAQGIYSSMYEGFLPGLAVVTAWKFTEYFEFPPSPGTIYWYSIGYNFANQLLPYWP